MLPWNRNPSVLFSAAPVRAGLFAPTLPGYACRSNGDSPELLLKDVFNNVAPPITLILNWSLVKMPSHDPMMNRSSDNATDAVFAGNWLAGSVSRTVPLPNCPRNFVVGCAAVPGVVLTD